MNGLSSRELRALQVIVDSVRERGYPPTLRELGDAIGLAAPSSVSALLDELEGKGWIRRVPGSARAITVTGPETDR